MTFETDSKRHPFIFLFTGQSGELYGYKDDWGPEGAFRYTGEGQLNHMEFVRGNKAIRDHAANGKDLLLFEKLPVRAGVRFLGRFACGSWQRMEGGDKTGITRQIIVFHLVPAEGQQIEMWRAIQSTEELAALRKRAWLAVSNIQAADPRMATRIYRERSDAVRAYVLSRARANCECCQKPAPFHRSDRTPYLEPHHTRRLSDGGPDHPRWVGAVCPNCHREIHYGARGNELNSKLEGRLGVLEAVAP